MLKYVLAFFAFIVVSLAPVYADEGYIPYFPDFMEPDGIGFRGPAGIETKACWRTFSSSQCSRDSIPDKTPFSIGYSSLRASPITMEYRKNYFFKRLLYFQSFADLDSTVSNNSIIEGGNWERNDDGTFYYQISDIGSNPFLDGFLTTDEKSKLSKLDNNRIFDLKTKSDHILFGSGIGLDLWLLELSYGPFLMYHDTTVTLRSCKNINLVAHGAEEWKPNKCWYYPDDIIKLDKQNYTGFAYGTQFNFNFVFWDAFNWRISIDHSITNVIETFDSKFNKVEYRGLFYKPSYRTFSELTCGHEGDREFTATDDSGNVISSPEFCTNSKGQDMSKSADYTYGLQITYYFR